MEGSAILPVRCIILFSHPCLVPQQILRLCLHTICLESPFLTTPLLPSQIQTITSLIWTVTTSSQLISLPLPATRRPQWSWDGSPFHFIKVHILTGTSRPVQPTSCPFLTLSHKLSPLSLKATPQAPLASQPFLSGRGELQLHGLVLPVSCPHQTSLFILVALPPFFTFVHVFLFVCLKPWGLQDLSSPTRGWNQALGNESAES